MADFDKITAFAFKWEGGYSAYDNDAPSWCPAKGTPGAKLIGTNRGISAQAYKAFYGKCPTIEEMKALTEAQAKMIYKKLFWDRIQGDKIKNNSVAQMMFQFIIGSGPGQLSDLKAIANATAGKKLFIENDQNFTVAQAEEINNLNQKKYWDNLKAWRHAYFIRICEYNPSLKMYLKGWQNRLNSFVFESSGIDKKKVLMIAGGSVLLLILVFSYFKQVTWKQKILAAISIGVIIYFGLKIYNAYKDNAFK